MGDNIPQPGEDNETVAEPVLGWFYNFDQLAEAGEEEEMIALAFASIPSTLCTIQTTTTTPATATLPSTTTTPAATTATKHLQLLLLLLLLFFSGSKMSWGA